MIVGFAVAAIAAFSAQPASAAPLKPANAKRVATAAYAKLPLTFETNQGQTDPRISFISHGSGFNLALAPTEAAFALKPSSPPNTQHPIRNTEVLKMRLLGGNPNAAPAGQDPLPGRVSYFRGHSAKEWHTNIPTYSKVRFNAVYPGIDVAYYGNSHRLEYDFLLSPGADPTRIRLGFAGAKAVKVSPNGDLVLDTAGKPVTHHKPVVYQTVNGARKAVPGRYTLLAKNEVGFKLGTYDKSRPLVIDPILAYATYIGGTGYDQGSAIALDNDGNAYVTGTTTSLDFPVLPYAPRGEGRYGANEDAYVVKLNPTGTQILYAVYLGGTRKDMGFGIAVDKDGNAYVTGMTESLYDPGNPPLDLPGTVGFPTTPNAYDPNGHSSDAFLSKISPDGTQLLYSTMIGSGSEDEGHAVAVDANGVATIAGMTKSYLDPSYPELFQNFPTTEGALQTSYGGTGLLDGDGFVSRFDTNASGAASLVYSTYFGGNGGDSIKGLALDFQGDAFISGMTSSDNLWISPNAIQSQYIGGGLYFTGDGFVAELNPTGTGVIYSTYLGGGSGDSLDAIALDKAGDAWVVGTTYSSELDQLYPVTPGAFQTSKSLDTCKDPWLDEDGNITDIGRDRLCSDVVISKVNPGGTQLLYSTYLGGNFVEEGLAIGIDADDNVYVGGRAGSTNFRVSTNLKFILPGGGKDGFLAKLNPNGEFQYITQTSARANAMAVSPAGDVYVTGTTWLDAFPVTPGAPQGYHAGNGDAFVACFLHGDYGWAPASQYYALSVSGGAVNEGGTDKLSLLLRATPPNPISYKVAPQVEVRRTDAPATSPALVSGTLTFQPGFGAYALLRFNTITAAPGEYKATFSFDDDVIVKTFAVDGAKAALTAPAVKADTYNDGSMRLSWAPVPGAKGYWVELYRKGSADGGESLQFIVAGPSDTDTRASLPAGSLKAGEQYAAFVYAVDMDPKAAAFPAAFTGAGGARADFALGTQPPPAVEKGDANLDGAVDVGDAILALQSTVGIVALTPEQAAAADMDASGAVDVGDAVAILKKVVGQ